MKITIEPTGKLTNFEGSPVRVWNGKTESGIHCIVLVRSLAVADNADQTEFERELKELPPPARVFRLSEIL